MRNACHNGTWININSIGFMDLKNLNQTQQKQNISIKHVEHILNGHCVDEYGAEQKVLLKWHEHKLLVNRYDVERNHRFVIKITLMHF